VCRIDWKEENPSKQRTFFSFCHTTMMKCNRQDGEDQFRYRNDLAAEREGPADTGPDTYFW
jgi:hypothetical protein